MTRKYQALGAVLVALLAPCPLWAQQSLPLPPRGEVSPQTPDTPPAPAEDAANANGTWTIQVENDLFNIFGRSDRDYTSGIRLGWMSGPTNIPTWITDFTTVPAVFGEAVATSAIRRWGVSVGQNIYTPEDIYAYQRIPNDRPYAGWLYLSGALQYTYLKNTVPVRQDTLQLDVGIVGPSAGGEWAQNTVHSIIKSQRANGWSNQLHDEPTVNLSFERRWRTFRTTLFEDPAVLELDFVPRGSISLGNVATYASAGGAFRIGKDLHVDFGAARARPSLPGSDAFAAAGKDFAWYLFAGADGQVWARNMFVDGNLDGTGSTVTRRPFVAEAQAGLALIFKGVRVTFSNVLRTPEFYERDRVTLFGSMNVTFRY